MSPAHSSPCFTIPFQVYFTRDPNWFNTLVAQLFHVAQETRKQYHKMLNIWDAQTQKRSNFFFQSGAGAHGPWLSLRTVWELTGSLCHFVGRKHMPRVPKQMLWTISNCTRHAYSIPFQNEPISFPFSKYLPLLSFLHDKMLIQGNNEKKREGGEMQREACDFASQAISKLHRALWSPVVFKIFFIPGKDEKLISSKLQILHISSTADRSAQASRGVTRPNRKQVSEEQGSSQQLHWWSVYTEQLGE